MEPTEVVQVKLGLIDVDEKNMRYGLKGTRIETLAADIAANGLMNPLEVEKEGARYKLTTGHYRFAALNKLEKEGAGIGSVSCIVRDIGDSTGRMKRQLSENNERENMTPMDKAIAIRRLLDAGVPRAEVRQLFSTPGGRKGMKVQEASNAHINMMVSFLEFTKDIRDRLHDGRLTVLAGYKLSKAPRDKWEAIVADAEAARIAQIDQEDKDETKYLEAEAKAREAQEKAETLAKELEEAKNSQTVAFGAVDAAAKAETDALMAARQGAKDDEEKKAKEAALKAATDNYKAAVATAEKAKTSTSKLEEKAKTAAQTAEERAKRLADARAAVKQKGKGKTTGAADIDAATARQTGTPGATPMTAVQMRECIRNWAELPGSYPKAQAVAKIIQNVFSGAPGCLTEKQGLSEIAVITGEKEPKGAKKGKGKEAAS